MILRSRLEVTSVWYLHCRHKCEAVSCTYVIVSVWKVLNVGNHWITVTNVFSFDHPNDVYVYDSLHTQVLLTDTVVKLTSLLRRQVESDRIRVMFRNCDQQRQYVRQVTKVSKDTDNVDVKEAVWNNRTNFHVSQQWRNRYCAGLLHFAASVEASYQQSSSSRVQWHWAYCCSLSFIFTLLSFSPFVLFHSLNF